MYIIKATIYDTSMQLVNITLDQKIESRDISVFVRIGLPGLAGSKTGVPQGLGQTGATRKDFKT